MTLNTYIPKNKIKISSISSASGIAYTTVSDMIKGNTPTPELDNGYILSIKRRLLACYPPSCQKPQKNLD